MDNILPARVGNAMKTISMNMRGMKEKGGETFPKLKKMLDDTTDGAVKLTQRTKEGKEEFRSTYDIIKDLSRVWDKLNDMQRSIISEKFAGKQNGNVFESLMKNAKDLEKMKQAAQDSAGSALQEQEAYMNSLDGKINAIKENLKGLFLDLGNTDFLKGTIETLDGVVGGVRKLIDVFGGLPVVIGLGTSAMMAFSNKTRESIKSNIPVIEELENRIKKMFRSNDSTNKINLSQKIEAIKKKINELEATFNNGGMSAMKYGNKILALKTKLSGLKIGLEATKIAAIAFESVLTGGIALLASFGIEKIVEWSDSLIHASAKLNEFNQNAKKLFDENGKTLDEAQAKFTRIQQLQKQISQTKEQKEKISLQKELNQLQIEMADILPRTTSKVNENNEAMATQNALIKEEIDLKNQELSDKADETADKNKKSIKEAIDGYEKLRKERKQLEVENKQGKTFGGVHFSDHDSWLGRFGIPTVKSVDDRLKDIQKKMSDSFSNILAVQKAMQVKMKQGWSDEQIKDKFGVSKKEIDDFVNGLNQTESASKKANTGLKTTDQVLQDLGLTAEKSRKKISDLAKSFDSFRSKKKIIQDAITEFKKFGKISGDTASKIFSTGDTKLISQLANKKDFLKNMQKMYKDTSKAEKDSWNQTVRAALEAEGAMTKKASIESNNRKNISQNETNVKANNYNNDANNHADSEDVKTQNADTGSQNRTDASANETNNKNEHYNTDTENHGGAEDTKTQNADGASQNRTEIQGQETKAKGKDYGIDKVNHAMVEKLKNAKASKNVRSIIGKIGKMVKKVGEHYGVDNTNFANALTARLTAVADFCAKAGAMLSNVLNMIKSVAHAVGDKVKDMMGIKDANPDTHVDTSHGSVSSGGYNPQAPSDGVDISDDDGGLDIKDPVGYDDDMGRGGSSKGHKGKKAKGGSGSGGHKKGKKSGSGGSGKGHGSSSSEKVDIKDIEDEIDRYKSLQDAIDDVNNSIDEKNSLEEMAHGTDKLNYIHEEISLYNKKRGAIDNLIDAKKREAKELENKLRANGFNAQNGDISNYTERLEAIKRNVNAMANSNKAKEKAIADYKKLKEQADKYFEITSKELPNLRKEWIETGKAIRDSQSKIIDMMSDGEKDMTDIIKNQIEKRKKLYEDDTNNLQEQLKKQKELRDNQFDEDDYQRNLKEKQDALDKLNQQIESTKRDDSSDGQARLKDLIEKQQEAEKDLNSFIRDRQKSKADEMFDKHDELIGKTKDDKLKAMEDTYTEAKISELAKGMIQKGFIELDGQIIKMRDAINDYYKDQGELFANSSVKLQEFIDKISITKQSYRDLSNMIKNLGVESQNIIANSGNNIVNLPKAVRPDIIADKNRQPNVTVKSDLHIGTLNEANLDELKRLLNTRDEKLSNEIINKISNELNNYY